MTAYTIKTDADETTLHADSMDAAAKQWARTEGYAHITTVDDLLTHIATYDGAWLWIEDEDGNRRGGSTPESMR